MKFTKKHLVLCIVLVIICILGVSCIHVFEPQELGTSEVKALGISEGYVLLLHKNGKFYRVQLNTGDVHEINGLPAVSKTM